MAAKPTRSPRLSKHIGDRSDRPQGKPSWTPLHFSCDHFLCGTQRGEALPDVDAAVAEQAIDLLDRVIGHQAAGLRSGRPQRSPDPPSSL
jgi:hypothetical protein